MSVTLLSGDNCTRDYADTYLKTDKFSYTWTIHDFDTMAVESYRRNLKSPKFLERHKSTTITWWITFIESGKFMPTNYQCLKPNTTELALIGHVSEKCKIFSKFQLSIVNECIEKSITSQIKEDIQLYEPGSELIFAKFPVPHSAKGLARKEGICPNGNLTIQCDITLLNEQNEMINQQVPNCELSDDISALLKTQNFCNVKLVVNSKEFHAHKFMLAARSSVFAALLEREADKINSTIEIINIDIEVFEEVLRYIYTGKISGLTVEMAMKLLVAAERYDLNRLRIMCEVFIDENVTKDNVIDILIIAGTHKSIRGMMQAKKFIDMYFGSVKKTNTFRSLCKSHPGLHRFFVERFKD